MTSSISQCLKRTTETPPKGWWLDVAGTRIDGGDYMDLVENVAKHFEARKEMPHNLPAYVQDALCRRLGTQSTRCRPCERSRAKLGFYDVWRWVRTMYAWTRKGFARVDRREAERRASICATCPENVDIGNPCLGCGGVGRFVRWMKGGESTSHDAKLKQCNRCGCYNEAAVWLPLAVQKRAAKAVSFPEWCWKRD